MHESISVAGDDVPRCSKEESRETREALLDAALEEFSARGVASPSLTDIAARVGMTRGAVYVHFENKGDLFAALLDRVMVPAQEMSRWDVAAEGPLDHLRATMVFLMRENATNRRWRCISSIVFHKCEKVEENSAIVQRLHTLREGARSHMKDLARRAMEAGELPADLDVDRAIPFVHSAVLGVISQWLLQPTLFDLAEEAERYADAFVDLLRTSHALRR
jgi:TetR/AcrR family acrAB operon transcriptional repressor